MGAAQAVRYDQAVIVRERLAVKYGEHIDGESNLTNEWWEKFCNLSCEQSALAKQVIAMNKFTDDDIEIGDEQIKDVLRYYQIRRSETSSTEEDN